MLKKILPVAIITIFLGIAGYFVYNYYNTQKELSEYKEYSTIQAIKEKNDLIKRIRKTVLLPDGEEPTVATVTDAYRLKDQKFFTQAENGDKVLIFAKAGRAILYRPNIDKVIESAPINISDLENNKMADQQVKESSNSVLGDNTTAVDPQEPAKIAVYNGTQTVAGLAGQASTLLKSKFGPDKIEIKELANSDQLFEETIVVNLTKNYNSLTKELIDLFKAKEENIPESEDKPDADLLIILGKDFIK